MDEKSGKAFMLACLMQSECRIQAFCGQGFPVNHFTLNVCLQKQQDHAVYTLCIQNAKAVVEKVSLLS